MPSSIFERLYTQPLHYRRLQPSANEVDTHGPMLSIKHELSDTPGRHNGFTYETAFRTTMKVETIWYANDAQYIGREQHARKDLLHYMYDPVLTKLRYILSAAYDRDFERIEGIVASIEKEILGNG